MSEKLSKVLIGGDLSRLNEEEKVKYYTSTCESLGLNPLTKPFAYIKLQGKETLYATKNATDQLRKVHGVSIVDCNQEKVGDLLIVTAKAQDKSGKTDVDVGVLPIGNLKGDTLANAIMKTVTKAKRRVTLSICGLGMLDETEIETIPHSQVEQPKQIQELAEDFPRLDSDTLKGPDYLYIKGKFRGARNKECDISEMQKYFNGYLVNNLSKSGGTFSNPEWQETYEMMKDWVDNYDLYQDVMAELEAEND